MNRSLLFFCFLFFSIACHPPAVMEESAELLLPPTTDSAEPSFWEVDPMQPIPTIGLTIEHATPDTYHLILQLENFQLQPVLFNAPNVNGLGSIHLHVNEQLVEVPLSETIELSADLLTEQTHLIVGLNSTDGSLLTYNGQEIQTELTISPDESFPITANNLSYALTWTMPSTPIVNDLGYEIMVDEGILLNASAELIACPEETSILDWFAPNIAYAGHGNSVVGESRIPFLLAEEIGREATHFSAVASASNDTYCQLHYLVAPAVDSIENLPNEQFIGKTILISGTYRAQNEAVASRFTIESTLAWGGMIDLPQPVVPSNRAVQIVINRPIENLFIGIDFDKIAADSGKDILRNLLAHTSIELIYP